MTYSTKYVLVDRDYRAWEYGHSIESLASRMQWELEVMGRKLHIVPLADWEKAGEKVKGRDEE